MATLQNTFSWSLTRERLFAECRRKYWLQYYGTWGGWEADAAHEIKVGYILKQLRTRHMWAGGIVHDAIEQVLAAWFRGRDVDPTAVEQHTVEGMRADFRSSRDRRYVHQPKTCALFEHHYNVVLEDTDWLRVRAHVSHCLRTFFRSQWAAELQALPADDWLAIERFAKFEIDGVPVIAKPDAAHRLPDGNGIRIIDWKTGKSQGGEEDVDQRFQLLLYTQFAVAKWGVPPESITAVAVNLHHDDADEMHFTQEDLDRLRARVVDSAEPMVSRLIDRDRARNEADAADFPMQDEPSACRRCSYKELCWREGWQDL